MGFGRYLRSGAWEVLLCAVAASALSYTACSGFYASLPLQGQPALIVAGCLVVCTLMFLVAYNVRAAVIGGIGLAVAIGVTFAALASLSPGMPLEDVEGNGALAFAVVVLPAVATFLLSRRKGTIVVLIVGGVYLCAAIEYLYWRGLVVALMVFVVSSVALMVYKSYQVTLKSTDAGWVRFGPVALVSVLVSAVALAIGWGVWVGVIEPLEPPSEQVKLIVEYRKAPEIEESAVGGVTPQAGSVGGDVGGGEEIESDESSKSDSYDTSQGALLQMLGLGDDDRADEGSTNALLPLDLLLFIVLALVVLAIVALLASVQIRRRVRFNRLVDGTPGQAMRNLYLYFLGAFEKLKINRVETESLTDFARNQAYLFESFEGFGFDSEYESEYASDYENSPDDDFDFALAAQAREEAAKAARAGEADAGSGAAGAGAAGAGADSAGAAGAGADATFASGFEALTDCYTRNVYGNEEPDDEELASFKLYYWSFYRNARLYQGRLRYVVSYFRL